MSNSKMHDILGKNVDCYINVAHLLIVVTTNC